MSLISRLFDLVIGLVGLAFTSFILYTAVWFICQMVGIDIDIYIGKFIEVLIDTYQKLLKLMVEMKGELHEWVIKRRE
jgi:hypothetical protein